MYKKIDKILSSVYTVNIIIKVVKPMIKISSFESEFKESCGWWEHSKEDRSEWTYEGRRTAG